MRYGVPSASIVVALLVWAAFTWPTPAANAGGNLLVNGELAAGAENQPLDGWTSWIWSGHGKVERLAPPDQKPHAVIINTGQGKQAIYQTVELSSCSYRLDVDIAARELVSNSDRQGAALFVSFEDGKPGIMRDIVRSGSSDWQHAEMHFRATAATKAIIYFFNYGSGAVFLRDVQLKAVPGCKDSENNFALTPLAGQRLDYTPPPTPHDFVLRGYCGDTAFRKHQVCLAKPSEFAVEPRRERLTLVDFEGQDTLFTGHEVGAGAAISGSRSARLTHGRYAQATQSSGLPGDWSGYDWLRLDVVNPTGRPAGLYIEISDSKTTNYWSRVNWTTSAPPGRSTLDVPLDVFVGEKSVIGDRRRLDLNSVNRLVLTATDTDLVIDDVRLETEPPFATVFPELIRFDLGTPTSPVMNGFSQVTAGDIYSDRRGWGFSNETVFGKSEDRRHPDNLLRDWVSIQNGNFSLDLPNGRYSVWMMLEDPGYWEYYPSFTRRTVSVQGREIESGIRSYEDFASRYWRHADDEDLPGDDVWSRYIPARYRPTVATAVVDNGRLELGFTGFGDPHAVPLSALVIFPESKEQEGQAFLKELWQRLKSAYDREYRQSIPPPPVHARPAPNVLAGDLLLFRRGAGSDIASNGWPEEKELTTQLDIALPRGTTEPITLGLLSRGDLSIVGAKVSVPNVTATLFTIRNKVTRATIDGSVYNNVPRVLDPLEPSHKQPLSLKADQTRGLWIDLSVQEAAASGQTRGNLVLSFADGRELEIPITVDVKAWSLPEADIPVGYLGIATHYPLATYPELATRRKREMSAGLELLENTGFTAYSGGIGGPRLIRYFSGKPQVDVADFRLSLEALAKSRIKSVLSYDGLAIDGLSTTTVEDTKQAFGKPYADVLGDVLGVVEAELSRTGLTGYSHSIADEPGEDGIDAIINVATAFKQTKRKVRTAAFTSVKESGDPRHKLAGIVDDIYLNLHSEEAIRKIITAGSRCSLYNQTGRYSRGVYLLKARDLQCGGHMQFGFHSVHADPWYDLDGREGDQVAVFTHPDGNLRVSMDFMRYRQAISDYRHLMLVNTLIVSGGGAARDDAHQWLNKIRDAMKVGASSPWTDGELDRIRLEAVSHIDNMVKIKAMP